MKKEINLNTQKFLWIIIILVITSIVYRPAFNNHFLNWDDNRYITENNLIKDINNQIVKSYFTQYYDGHYHPLTLLSLAIDYKLNGKNPFWFHFTNLFLHLCNVLMVFWLTNVLINRKQHKNSIIIPLVTSFLFAINTINVESVAWMSERKNVLFTLFFLASLISYIKYVKTKRPVGYYIALILFILSILSKVTAITLAFSIILVDFFYNRKLLSKKVILEKLPFILLTIFFGIVASKAQEFTWGNTDLETAKYSFLTRILFAASSFILYIIKSIIPFKLSAFYPYPQNTEFLTIFKYALYLIPAILFVIGSFYSLKKNKIIFFGLIFFMINIAMLLKLFEVPAGNYIMADRYAYVPSIGLYLIIGYFINWLFTRYTNKKLVIIAFSILYLSLLGWHTNKYIKVWKNNITLFTSIIKNHPEVSIAWNNRGLAKKDAGNIQGAIRDLSKVIELRPDMASAYSNRGNLFAQTGEHKKAISDYNTIIKLLPNDSMAYFNRAVSKAEIKNWAEAITDYNYAISKMPKNSTAYMNRGVAYAGINNFNSAIIDFNVAISLDSSYANAWFNRGIAKAKLKDFDGAISDFDQAIKRNANYINAYFSRSIAKELTKDYYGAIEDLSLIIKINPGYAPAYVKRGYIRIYLKDFGGCNDLKQAEHLGIKVDFPKECGN